MSRFKAGNIGIIRQEWIIVSGFDNDFDADADPDFRHS